MLPIVNPESKKMKLRIVQEVQSCYRHFSILKEIKPLADTVY